MRAVAVLVVATACLAGCSDPPDAEPATPSAAPTTPSAEPPTTPPSGESECDAPCYDAIEDVGTLTEDIVVEVSGMAASERTPSVFYVVSDEAGTSEVAVVREDGTLVARIEVDGMDARNAEALAVGPCGSEQDETCLYVGDIGDHVGRENVVVYRVPEPDLSATSTGAVAAEALEYTYPDGPTDAEALLVDDAGRPVIVSKASFDRDTGETGATRLYRGPVDGGVLEPLGEIDLPEPQTGLLASVVGNVVTDASAADGRVLLRTYDEVVEYRAGRFGADLAGFPQWPVRRVPSPSQLQSETVTYRVDGCGYLTTSELTGSIDAVTGTCRERSQQDVP